MFTATLVPSDVVVSVEEHRGHSPDFWAEAVTNKIVGVSVDAAPHVQMQAQAYRDRIQAEVLRGIANAIRSDRQTIAGELRRTGHDDLANWVVDLKP